MRNRLGTLCSGLVLLVAGFIFHQAGTGLALWALAAFAFGTASVLAPRRRPRMITGVLFLATFVLTVSAALSYPS